MLYLLDYLYKQCLPKTIVFRTQGLSGDPVERGGWGGLKSHVLCNTELLQAPSHTGFIDGLQIGRAGCIELIMHYVGMSAQFHQGLLQVMTNASYPFRWCTVVSGKSIVHCQCATGGAPAAPQ